MHTGASLWFPLRGGDDEKTGTEDAADMELLKGQASIVPRGKRLNAL